MDWSNLGFDYIPTNGYVQVDCVDGIWGEPALRTDPMISLHVGANCLHYGQACFEGLKAFGSKDGKVNLFRPDENAKRLMDSCDRICMEAPGIELFMEACQMAVRANLEFVPPYGTGASMYLRPLVIGTEAMFAVRPSVTYSFYMLANPVGPYYKDGFSPVSAMVIDQYDRAAPRGTGQTKVAGNYAAGLKAASLAKKQGYPIVLYLDAAEGKYIDEFGTSNFMGITKDGVYKTPASDSILPSITNKSLMQLARDLGLEVVREPIAFADLDQFEEVGACGTAAVITPIHSITRDGTTLTFGEKTTAGPTLQKLYSQLQGIQYGDLPDTHGWLVPVE